MKKTNILFFCLALTSLACLQSSAISESETAEGATAGFTPDEVYEPTLTKVATAAPAPQICAVVIAEDALHMRQGASEKDIVLTWLQHGDVVHVVDKSNGDWWIIERAGVSGYARSIYLKESECT